MFWGLEFGETGLAGEMQCGIVVTLWKPGLNPRVVIY